MALCLANQKIFRHCVSSWLSRQKSQLDLIKRLEVVQYNQTKLNASINGTSGSQTAARPGSKLNFLKIKTIFSFKFKIYSKKIKCYNIMTAFLKKTPHRKSKLEFPKGPYSPKRNASHADKWFLTNSTYTTKSALLI